MKRAAAVLFPYAVFGLLLAASWNCWIEPYIDSGRELMVPWRLAHGESLYGDLQFYHGPLGPYVAGAVDRVLGPSLPARIGLALLVALLHLEALRRLALQFLPPARASLSTGLAVATAVFLRPGGWLFPFSLDTAIAVAGLTAALVFRARADRLGDAIAAGCLSAVLLSRLELGVVGAVALAWETRRQPRRWRILVATPLLLAATAYLAVSWRLPLHRLISDGWLALARPPSAFQNVYRAYAGLDRPGFRATELALAAVLLTLAAALIVTGAAVAARVRGRTAVAALEALVPGVLAAVAAACLFPTRSLASALALLPPLVRVVPPVVIIMAAIGIVRNVTGRTQRSVGPSEATLLVAAMFAARLLLAAGYIGPYDAFFLPLPLILATGLALMAADAIAPSIGESLPKITAAALVVFLTFRVVLHVESYRRLPWISVSTPAGRLRLQEPVATTTRLALEDLARRVPASGAMVGFPEGGFFNYVLSRANPTDREQFFPGTIETPAEEGRVIRRLAESPPDAVFLCNVLAVGEDQPAFGSDYLVRLDRFLRRDFVAAASYGPGAGPDARVGDPQFFVTIRVPRRDTADSPR